MFVASWSVRASVRLPDSAIPSDEVAIWGFLAAFAAATLLVLLLLRRTRHTRFVEAVFLVAMFGGIGFALDAIFGHAVAIIGTSAAVFMYYAARSVLLFNVLLIVGCAGIAANLGGAMRSTGAAVILAFLAVYDIVAVYVTKHMIEMAESMLRRKVFFAMIVAERPADVLLPVTAVTRGSGFTFFGTGDLILPTLLVTTVAKHDVAGAFAVSIGALAGVAALFFFFTMRPNRTPMPALPPIAVGALIAYLGWLLL